MLDQDTANRRANVTQCRVVTQRTIREGTLQTKNIKENLAEQRKPKEQNSQHHHTAQHNTQHDTT